MFHISTNRVRLVPLTYTQLQLLAQSREHLERQMQLASSTFELNSEYNFLEEFQEAISDHVLPLVSAHPKDYLWYTHWLIVHRESNLAIGGMGVSGKPDEQGQTMLGYFIDVKFEGQGYATEAVQGFLSWLFQQQTLKSVIADTPSGHIASQRVLQKNGFELQGEVPDGLRWQISR